MEISNIIFDFDGVLAESVHIKSMAFKQMYLDYGESFSERVLSHHQNNGGMSRFEKFKIYNGQWLSQRIDEEVISKLANKFSMLVVEGVVNSKEVEGASFFLEKYTEFKKYIITGTPDSEIKKILDRRQMSQYFESIHGSPNSKDFWIKKLLESKKISSNDSIFIGDAMVDFKAAQKNNIKFILRNTTENFEIFKNINVLRIDNLFDLDKLLIDKSI